MGQTYVWMDWFKLHDDLQNEIYRRFNAHLHFPFNYVTMRGWEIHRKHCKTLFRHIELQPGEYLFRFSVESSFFLHMPSVQEHAIVFETVLLLCLYSWSSISSSQVLGANFFLKKLHCIQASLYLICIINRLHDANNKMIEIEHNVMQERNRCNIFRDGNFY